MYLACLLQNLLWIFFNNYVRIKLRGAKVRFVFEKFNMAFIITSQNISLMKIKKLPILLTTLLIGAIGVAGFGQGTEVQFGKNRVQFHQDFDEWSQYESDNFITYWYGEGRNIGQAAVQLAEYDFEEVQNLLEHRMNQKIEIIVYTDLTDLKQSNIGSEEAFYNTGGQTKIVENKIFVYFNGDHRHLRRQIREGIASVYLNAMLFGANLQEIVQNAVMMNLPVWFKDGLVSFVGKDWDTETDNQMRDVILNEKYKNFEDFAKEQPELAGHSLWYFIFQTYGGSTVSNLLYLTRINRSIESGFLYVLGSSYQKITAAWAIYFNERYKQEIASMVQPEGTAVEVKNKRNLPLNQVKISPNGQKIAYVANEIGKYKVFIQDVNTGERELVMKKGARNPFQATDYNYPLLAWNPNSLELAIMYERRDVIKLATYDVTTKRITTEDMSTQYQRIHSMDFSNPSTLVLSATVRGFSDIFLYFLATRQTQRLTNDLYDDLDATYVKVRNQKGILFASNRPDSLLGRYKLDTILPINNFDLFYYDLENNSKELIRITHTPMADERQPIAIDTSFFAFTSDENGVTNRKVGYLEDYIARYEQFITMKDGFQLTMHVDSSLNKLDTANIANVEIRPVIKTRGVSYLNTNYWQNIKEQHTSPRTGKLVELLVQNGENKFYIHTLDASRQVVPVKTTFMQQAGIVSIKTSPVDEPADAMTDDYGSNNYVLQETPIDTVPKTIEVVPEEPDTAQLDIDNYFFQTDFDEEEEPAEVVIDEDKGEMKLQRPQPQIIEQQRKTKEAPTIIRFRSSRIIPYRLKFKTDYVTTKLDNGYLFEDFPPAYNLLSSAGSLENHLCSPQGIGYPPTGILLKSNFKDLFEDYEFEGGIRVPTTFNGAEYFLIFNNKKKRLDKSYTAYYRKNRITSEPVFGGTEARRAQVNTILGRYAIRYPLDIFTSIRASATLRQDDLIHLATDASTLNRNGDTEQRAGLKVEYVFDNTLDVAINIKNGTRYKVYAEVMKRFELNFLEGASLNFGEGFLGLVGFDARHYVRLGKHSVLALRAAGASSFGSTKILYYLGGVDNWLFPVMNNEIPKPTEGDFAYQTIAANLRGFRLNIRNGNSYVLSNAELRVPLFKYLFPRTNNSFLRNFQVVGFFDVGTAWQGPTPFTDDNPLNTTVISNPAVEVKVNYFRDPLVAGYGFGVRSMLFGYFIRADYAWGIETRQVLDKGRLYLSMGMDF